MCPQASCQYHLVEMGMHYGFKITREPPWAARCRHHGTALGTTDGGTTVPTDPPALRWLDAFPWIEAASAGSGNVTENTGRWWLEPIEGSGTAQRSDHLADISDLALERLTRWTIGQIFPSLPAGTVLSGLSMTNRARNAFSRLGYQTAGDLQALELGELLDMPQVGIGTVDSIVQALADASTTDALPVILSTRASEVTLYEHDHRSEPPHTEFFVDDIRMVASWYAALGMPERPLLGMALPPCIPPEIEKARQRLEMLSAGDVVADEQAGLDVAQLLQHAVNALDHRAQQILARRFFADKPDTLEVLGRALSVTRERVRQLEAKARSEMVDSLGSGSLLGNVSATVQELVGTVLPLADLIALVPALAHPVEAVGQPAWRVLDRLDDAYEIEDGWCATPTVLSAQTETLTRLQELANSHGVVRIEDLGPLNPNQPLESGEASQRNWLRHCGWILDGDYVFTRTQSVGDRAASILSVAGSPMMSQEILDRFDIERSLSSLRNALASDDRFERVDRDTWALAEWGLDTYSGVRALVRAEVARNGGQITMEELIERITGGYNVTAGTVIAYASAPPFEASSGMVRLAVGDREVRKGPDRTRRLYRRPNAWLYRVKVTKDHSRGSGSPAPIAIAAMLGIQPGHTQQLSSTLGPQSISWTGNQPSFGTIRRFLVADDIETGSEVFLVIGDDGSFCIEPVEPGGANSLDRALRLIGATGSDEGKRPLTSLATAIGLPPDSPTASVIGGYRERGDADIAELLLSARDMLDDSPTAHPAAQSANIDEIMDLLLWTATPPQVSGH
jgi:hypothetical protein